MIEPGLWDMIMRLRMRGISDTRVIAAFEKAPRSRFVPEAFRDQAFEEADIPLPCGQTLLPPLLVGQMLQLASIAQDDKVLVVGLGSGQVAGLAAQLSRRVYGMERYQILLALAEANLARAGVTGVTSRWGDGRYGWKANAPFDVIIVTAALDSVPEGLRKQLSRDGRLLGVVDGKLSVVTPETVKPYFPVDIARIETGKSEAL